ncbi:MAG TPA: magnesium and cobalt transport protein CorA [Rubrobacter sp.]|nr:magnesium and cobalt transport protein CorA [Rubrobacter sp.]
MSTRVTVYQNGKKAEGKYSLSDASSTDRDDRAVVWISLVEPSKEELDCVTHQFGTQELAQEDAETRKGIILNHQGRRLTLMVSPARYLDGSRTVEIGELDVLLEEGLAITVSRGEGPEMRDVEQSLEESSDLSRLGAGAILHALLYRVVNDYAPVVDGLRGDLAGLEYDVLQAREVTGRMTNRLYELSRQVLRFQRATEHLEAVLESLADPDSQNPGLNPELAKRLDGARGRARRINSRVSEFSVLLQNLFSTNLTLVSVKQNEQTRRISAWAAIIAVPTVIASIYGMNFRYMPELYLRFGYPVAVLVMVASCVVLYAVFKRIGWL